ncbi:MAG: preprotein translocase subunit SecY [Lachnospiraceae bacterium]|nr:preprotein translocase subunit SecY [Lachnospiraceae bacterium]
MLKTLRDALKIKDIRTRIFYTFAMLAVFRLGSLLPTPGVNSAVVDEIFAGVFGTEGAISNFFQAITGGSYAEMSIFALNIGPYITSSIIMQLLTIAIPKFEEWQKDGEDGKKKISQISRYLTIALAIIQSGATAIGFGAGGALEKYNFFSVMIFILAMTAGSALVMWIGEQITEKGIGNGISMILLVNILSSIPNDFRSIYNKFIVGRNPVIATVAAVLCIVLILALVMYVIVLQDAERRIPVQYAQKVQGRRQVGGQSSHIPLKVNTAGVIPVIFAGSLLSLPVIVAQIANVKADSILGHVMMILNQQNWCNPEAPLYSFGLLIYIALIIIFAYFYTSITFSPLEVSENMKKQSGMIPGIRPGKPTAEHLTRILNYIVLIGAVGLVIVAIIPIIISGVFALNISFLGTSIIIVVGVVLETMKQVESKMTVRHYKGFLNE